MLGLHGSMAIISSRIGKHKNFLLGRYRKVFIDQYMLGVTKRGILAAVTNG